MIKFDSMDDARAFTLGINAIIAAAVAEERAAVVAWLNHAADTRYYDCCCGPVAACAEAIERGDHRREEEK